MNKKKKKIEIYATVREHKTALGTLGRINSKELVPLINRKVRALVEEVESEGKK